MSVVLGVDACKGGWAGIVLGGSAPRGVFGATIEQVVSLAIGDDEVAVVAIDIPIGLPDVGVRESDRVVRASVGRRSSSVFMTPVRESLDSPTHAGANAISRAIGGVGLSAQAYALRAKILEVDAWVRGGAGVRVVEAHPELCFATIADEPLAHNKKTWDGMTQRRGLLKSVGIELPSDLGPVGARAAVDDVLDAAAAAWTAGRVAAGQAIGRPDPPEQFSDGLDAAIWV